MKQFKHLCLVFFTGMLTVPLTGQDLSFNIDISYPNNKEPFIMKVMVSGTKVAMVPQNTGGEGKMTFLMDNTTGKQYILMDASGQKMAMAVNMSEVEKKSEAIKEPKITNTKETKTVDGYKCTKVIAETEGETTDLWITQDVGFQYSEFMKMMNTTKGPQGPVATIPALNSLKGFPIEIATTDKSKKETVLLKIKNISKVKIDPKVFSMEGYQLMDSGMMTR